MREYIEDWKIVVPEADRLFVECVGKALSDPNPEPQEDE